jgi:hypothetical protein
MVDVNGRAEPEKGGVGKRKKRFLPALFETL